MGFNCEILPFHVALTVIPRSTYLAVGLTWSIQGGFTYAPEQGAVVWAHLHLFLSPCSLSQGLTMLPVLQGGWIVYPGAQGTYNECQKDGIWRLSVCWGLGLTTGTAPFLPYFISQSSSFNRTNGPTNLWPSLLPLYMNSNRLRARNLKLGLEVRETQRSAESASGPWKTKLRNCRYFWKEEGGASRAKK